LDSFHCVVDPIQSIRVVMSTGYSSTVGTSRCRGPIVQQSVNVGCNLDCIACLLSLLVVFQALPAIWLGLCTQLVPATLSEAVACMLGTSPWPTSCTAISTWQAFCTDIIQCLYRHHLHELHQVTRCVAQHVAHLAGLPAQVASEAGCWRGPPRLGVRTP